MCRECPIEERLERGEVVYYPNCPFPMPQGDDRDFLNRQRLSHRGHKNISYDPPTERVKGGDWKSAADHERLLSILATFSRNATAWLAATLPRYAATWQLDQVSFRPEEEAGRQLRQKARNDLLHVDAFPSRPTNGQRILRLFVNTNTSEPRVWITAAPFAVLLERYGAEVGVESALRGSVIEHVKEGIARLVKPSRPKRSPYDRFMLRFHDHLKASQPFQTGPRREWIFPPGSCWLAMTDTCSHAVLRGRSALEHSYFIQPGSLALPDESPAALLARAARREVLLRAA
jgi:3-deoxy-D-manno-oct-2-ulosonic acid (Kdo) hydroxylase